MTTKMNGGVLILIISISPRYLKAKADFYPHTVALLSDFYFLLNSFLVMPQSNK